MDPHSSLFHLDAHVGGRGRPDGQGPYPEAEAARMGTEQDP